MLLLVFRLLRFECTAGIEWNRLTCVVNVYFSVRVLCYTALPMNINAGTRLRCAREELNNNNSSGEPREPVPLPLSTLVCTTFWLPERVRPLPYSLSEATRESGTVSLGYYRRHQSSSKNRPASGYDCLHSSGLVRACRMRMAGRAPSRCASPRGHSPCAVAPG